MSKSGEAARAAFNDEGHCIRTAEQWDAIAAAAIEASDEVQRLRALFEVVQLALASEDDGVDVAAIVDLHLQGDPHYALEQLRLDLGKAKPMGRLRDSAKPFDCGDSDCPDCRSRIS